MVWGRRDQVTLICCWDGSGLYGSLRSSLPLVSSLPQDLVWAPGRHWDLPLLYGSVHSFPNCVTFISIWLPCASLQWAAAMDSRKSGVADRGKVGHPFSPGPCPNLWHSAKALGEGDGRGVWNHFVTRLSGVLIHRTSPQAANKSPFNVGLISTYPSQWCICFWK